MEEAKSETPQGWNSVGPRVPAAAGAGACAGAGAGAGETLGGARSGAGLRRLRDGLGEAGSPREVAPEHGDSPGSPGAPASRFKSRLCPSRAPCTWAR